MFFQLGAPFVLGFELSLECIEALVQYTYDAFISVPDCGLTGIYLCVSDLTNRILDAFLYLRWFSICWHYAGKKPIPIVQIEPTGAAVRFKF